jgi:hypothetical protein
MSVTIEEIKRWCSEHEVTVRIEVSPRMVCMTNTTDAKLVWLPGWEAPRSDQGPQSVPIAGLGDTIVEAWQEFKPQAERLLAALRIGHS